MRPTTCCRVYRGPYLLSFNAQLRHRIRVVLPDRICNILGDEYPAPADEGTGDDSLFGQFGDRVPRKIQYLRDLGQAHREADHEQLHPGDRQHHAHDGHPDAREHVQLTEARCEPKPVQSALPIWVDIMKTADRLDYKAGKLNNNTDLVEVELCRLSGKRATAGCREAATAYLDKVPADIALPPGDLCPIHPARALPVGEPDSPLPAATPLRAIPVDEREDQDIPLRAIPVEE